MDFTGWKSREVIIVRLHLVDDNPDVSTALSLAFRPFPKVVVSHGDLLAVAHNAVVSPANSQGFMDGGIDARFRSFFGAEIEHRVRDAIGRRQEGHLPVGVSLVIHTGNTKIPYLIVAPTMLSPESVDSQNCYRAMRAVLRTATQEGIGDAVFCSGLGTGVGQVEPIDAAREMALAYQDWKAKIENSCS